LTANDEGSFTLINGRSGFSKTYLANGNKGETPRDRRSP